MRKALLAIAAIVVVLVAADFGTAAYAEYRVSRTVRASAGLDADPDVTISAVPFLTSVPRGRARSITISTPAPDPLGGVSSVSLRLEGVSFSGAGPLADPDGPLHAERAVARWSMVQTDLGRLLGIGDLEVSAPTSAVSATAHGPGTMVGLSGTIRTGRGASVAHERVSVLAELAVVGTTLRMTPIGVLAPGPGAVPRGALVPTLDEVGPAFTAAVAIAPLPYGIAPEDVHVAESSIIVDGHAANVTVRPGGTFASGGAPADNGTGAS